jgi:hypothetical protein
MTIMQINGPGVHMNVHFRRFDPSDDVATLVTAPCDAQREKRLSEPSASQYRAHDPALVHPKGCTNAFHRCVQGLWYDRHMLGKSDAVSVFDVFVAPELQGQGVGIA